MFLKNVLLFIFFIPLAQAFDHGHSSFTKILQKSTTNRDGQTWVDYTSLQKESRIDLQDYLKSLQTVTKSGFDLFLPNQRLAFLINAYNAFTLEWILIHYPVKSIKDTGSLFSSPWKKTFPGYTLLGSEFNLDKIEHDFIRKNFMEPRIHFAVNCASIGCPSLRRKAYTGTDLEAELAEVEREFFFNPRHFNLRGGEVSLSSILKWYGDDFKKVHGSLEKYLEKKVKEYEIHHDVSQKLKINFSDYDWSLNGK